MIKDTPNMRNCPECQYNIEHDLIYIPVDWFDMTGVQFYDLDIYTSINVELRIHRRQGHPIR